MLPLPLLSRESWIFVKENPDRKKKQFNNKKNQQKLKHFLLAKTEAAHQRCSYKKVFWKYAADLQENTNAEVWFKFPISLLHIFRIPFPKNTSGWLLLEKQRCTFISLTLRVFSNIKVRWYLESKARIYLKCIFVFPSKKYLSFWWLVLLLMLNLALKSTNQLQMTLFYCLCY